MVHELIPYYLVSGYQVLIKRATVPNNQEDSLSLNLKYVPVATNRTPAGMTVCLGKTVSLELELGLRIKRTDTMIELLCLPLSQRRPCTASPKTLRGICIVMIRTCRKMRVRAIFCFSFKLLCEMGRKCMTAGAPKLNDPTMGPRPFSLSL